LETRGFFHYSGFDIKGRDEKFILNEAERSLYTSTKAKASTIVEAFLI
jgi:hypothetical protein